MLALVGEILASTLRRGSFLCMVTCNGKIKHIHFSVRQLN